MKLKIPAGAYSYTVGAKGLGTSSIGVAGTNGGDTTFGTAVARGGVGGGGTGGAGGGGPLGANTTLGTVLVNITGGYAGSSLSNGLTAPGGAGFMGLPQPTNYFNYSAGVFNATGYGGGGSGSSNVTLLNSGDGSGGYIFITEVN